MGPCIANMFPKYNQKDATLHNLFISVKCSTCFRRFLRPSSEAQSCTGCNRRNGPDFGRVFLRSNYTDI